MPISLISRPRRASGVISTGWRRRSWRCCGRKRRTARLSSFCRCTDLTGFGDAAAAERIHADGIDVRIDLTGYTSENPRTRILAFRPAPIQVNFLGYPATMGADFIDYIIVDGFLAPEDQQPWYGEKLVQLPYCYQPSDTARPSGTPVPSRAACGLPAEGFVFCCRSEERRVGKEGRFRWWTVQ